MGNGSIQGLVDGCMSGQEMRLNSAVSEAMSHPGNAVRYSIWN